MLNQDSKLTVGLITSSSLPMLGGAEIGLHNIALHLLSKGHKPILFTSWSHAKRLKQQQWHLSYDVVAFPPKILSLIQLYPKIALFLGHLLLQYWRKKYAIDIWHGTFGYPIGVLLGASFLKKSFPYIIRCVGDDIQRMPDIHYGMRLDSKVNHLFEQYFIHAPLFIATTKTIKKEYLNLSLDKNNIYMLSNGVDVERLNKKNLEYDIRKSCGFSDDDYVLLALGRNHPKKNFQMAINMFHSISATYKQQYKLKLLVAGYDVGSLRQYTQNDSSIGIIDTKEYSKNTNLNFPDDLIVCCYQQSNIFLMTSLIETFGVVLIEAMAAGLPIISTKIPGCIDVVRNGKDAIVIESGAEEELQQAVKMLVENKKLYEEYKDKSLKRAKAFCWDIIVDGYVDAYNKTIRKQ